MAVGQTETGFSAKKGQTGELKSIYQFEPGTWKTLAGRILGDSNAPLTLENENKVAYTRIKEWKDHGMNPGQIASMWNSGQPDPSMVRNGGVGPTSTNPNINMDVPGYQTKVYNNYLKFRKQLVPDTQSQDTSTFDHSLLNQPENTDQKMTPSDVAAAPGNAISGMWNAFANAEIPGTQVNGQPGTGLGIPSAAKGVGALVSVPSAVIGGGIGLIGNLLTGQNPIQGAMEYGGATGQFGYDIGKQATAPALAGMGLMTASAAGPTAALLSRVIGGGLSYSAVQSGGQQTLSGVQKVIQGDNSGYADIVGGLGVSGLGTLGLKESLMSNPKVTLDKLKQAFPNIDDGEGGPPGGPPRGGLKELMDTKQTNPDLVKAAFERVNTNPQSPFDDLATSLGDKLKQTKEDARVAFEKGVTDAKTQSPDVTYNIQNRIPELNKILDKYNLQVNQVKGADGKFTGDVELAPTTRTSPYFDATGKPSSDLATLNDVVNRMRTKNMSGAEVLDLDKLLNNARETAYENPNPSIYPLTRDLVAQSRSFIDDALPQVHEANQMYSDYYKAMENGGNKIIDKAGNVKPSASSFLSNLTGKNKGITMINIENMDESLGTNYAQESRLTKTAQDIATKTPKETVTGIKSVIRKFTGGIGGKIFEAAGLAGHPLVSLATFALDILTHTSLHPNLAEALEAEMGGKSVPKGVPPKLNTFEKGLLWDYIKKTAPVTGQAGLKDNQ